MRTVGERYGIYNKPGTFCFIVSVFFRLTMHLWLGRLGWSFRIKSWMSCRSPLTKIALSVPRTLIPRDHFLCTYIRDTLSPFSTHQHYCVVA
ncbi:hypothetical protein JAAARDRAFT_648954 [Jaapia argillacea MUCL 33604]|uniref:Uncharacterized protein n=1 Tax=Jaapia argillacea MUCL 33604 TaxID=933084 RepID=A0A067PYM3_9AGAM|nr:hypothetical protein JAAARDRAFT_648954 [Jaapia argillacea MUCL 33604]